MSATAPRLVVRKDPRDESATDRYARFERALGDADAPLALVDLRAWEANAQDLVRRAAGKPIRVASKSVRCRALLAEVLERPGFQGILAFTLPEALWLAGHGFDDIVVGYPTTDRRALAELAADEELAPRITLMVDGPEQLALIERVANPPRARLRVCIDIDASFALPRGGSLGVKRSPLRTAAQAAELAQDVVSRPSFKLVGLMAYEAQIAGVGDRPPGKKLYASGIAAMQWASRRELKQRRAEIVARVREIAELEFINGGGTGSVESTACEECVTEVAAGSGLFAPTLFDYYSAFTPVPAAFFALPVVRRPAADVVTVLGGGYVASGSAGNERLPAPVLPAGLKLDGMEGAGEVQTPLLGDAASRLQVGDRVYFRHAKAGELCEHFPVLRLIEDDAVAREVPTYRGEGQHFL